MSEIRLIQGEIFHDHRGTISSLNNFRFDEVERCYFIHHPDTSVIRGWHGHQFEKKWFYCLKGAFTLAFVEIDNWENPSSDLEAKIFTLTDQKSEIICLPEGYANGVKASKPDSILLVYSDKLFNDALLDSWRYDSSMWLDWSKF